ncbi:hypothetical protein [Halobaculum sp. P14]|uniref:hypothetical protein n=1 Tax=Halobaculum sp. P14 TaxID=3421638 RepID=UPI003EBC5D83
MDLTTTPEQRRAYADRVRSGGLRARAEAGERGDALRSDVGDRLFDLLAENFPEEYAARRRRDAVRAFGAGVVVGLVAREALRRR